MIICDTCGKDLSSSKNWLILDSLPPDQYFWARALKKKYPQVCRECFEIVKTVCHEEIVKAIETVSEKLVEIVKLKQLGK